MPISKEEFEQEQEYLNTVMHFLMQQLDLSKDKLDMKKDEVIELNKTMMDDIGNDVESLGKFVDAYSYLVEIGSRAGAMHNSEIEYARLNTLKDTPYFARMDFETGGKTAKIYIGTGSLMDPESLDFYVFDWRSPIAGMYYDYEIGPAEYQSPGGQVTGELSLKRQFKIWRGTLLSAYDTSVAIGDEMLSQALSKSADSKMQSIVCTIQREQNLIIRNKESRYLIAFGPAGSGKTSVAMQRAAFFLYAFRDTVTSANIMIFSPNNVFGDYISEVLPHLGEVNVKSITLTDYAKSLFGDRYSFLSSGELLDFAMHPNGIRERSAKLKLSENFRSALHERVDALSKNAMRFPDMVYSGKILISGEEMTRLYTKDFSYLSVQGRLNKLYARVCVFAKEEYKRKLRAATALLGDEYDENEAKEQLVKLRWEIREEHKSFLADAERLLSADPQLIYLEVLSALDKNVAEFTRADLERGIARAEDAAPLLYILSATREIKNEVKYLIVDEAQDYSPLAIDVMKNCFSKASITFLGDANQTVCPLSLPATPEIIAEIFPEAKVESLKKSYRSTAEINEFAGRLLNLDNADYMKRSGEKVTLSRLKTREDYLKALVLESKALQERGLTSAVIFPTAAECEELYNAFGKVNGIKLIRDTDKSFATGQVIIPAYMAKGLEFDAVLIPYNSFEDEALKNVLYTSVTRALHVLKLYRY